MSETPLLRGIVLAHGSLAEGLVDAVTRISGVDGDALVPLSNSGLSPESLALEIRAVVGEGPAIVFTDLPSGSCGFAARRICNERPGLAVVSGVNLPILLDFVTHRDMPLPDLVNRLLDRGRASLCCAPPRPENHDDRPVSG